jgi:hypothetical protein
MSDGPSTVPVKDDAMSVKEEHILTPVQEELTPMPVKEGTSVLSVKEDYFTTTVHDEVASSSTEATTRSPRTHIDSSPLPTDSMVTVPLSENGTNADDEESSRASITRPEIIVEERPSSSRPNSSEILAAFGRRDSHASVDTPALDSPTVQIEDADEPTSPISPQTPQSPQSPTIEQALDAFRDRSGSNGSGKSDKVDWAELEKKEEQQKEPQGEEEVRCHPPIIRA